MIVSLVVSTILLAIIHTVRAVRSDDRQAHRDKDEERERRK